MPSDKQKSHWVPAFIRRTKNRIQWETPSRYLNIMKLAVQSRQWLSVISLSCPSLEPISRRQLPVCLSGSLISRGCPVALEHGA